MEFEFLFKMFTFTTFYFQKKQENVRVQAKEKKRKQTSFAQPYRPTGLFNDAYSNLDDEDDDAGDDMRKTKEVGFELKDVSDSGYSGRSTLDSLDRNNRPEVIPETEEPAGTNFAAPKPRARKPTGTRFSVLRKPRGTSF